MEMGRKSLHACVTTLYEARSCIPSHCDQKGTSLAKLGKVGMNSSHLAHFFCSATQAEPVGRRTIGVSLSAMNGGFVCIYLHKTRPNYQSYPARKWHPQSPANIWHTSGLAQAHLLNAMHLPS